MSSSFAPVLAIIPMLMIESFFSGSEIALLSADKLRLKEAAAKGSLGAKRALELASHPERVLSTTLLLTNLAVIGISTIVALELYALKIRHGEFLAIIITSPIVVILGELIPKTLYQRHADRLAPVVALPVMAAFWAFYPLTKLLSSYTHKLSRFIGPLEELLTGRSRSLRDDLRALLSYGKRETEIKPSERRMIKRIFDFKDTEAKHALIPLVKVDAVDIQSTVREALESFEKHRHSRMPVFEDRIDNIVGLLEATDLFAAIQLDAPIKNYVSAAQYAPETQSLEDLLRNLRREDNSMVVVVDEYGGAVGILTFEDIVEEIVGEIEDEYDSDSEDFIQLSDTSWQVQARMEIAAINEKLGMDLPEGEYETLGGFLLQQFGRIPEARDELHFNTPGTALRFVVRKANERQIQNVLVEKLTPSPS